MVTKVNVFKNKRNFEAYNEGDFYKTGRFVGYGKTQKQALDKLKQYNTLLILKLQSIDYDQIVLVDVTGKIIK